MRVALVTGGTRGIGFSIAKALSERDYLVYAVYHADDESAKRAKSLLPSVNFVKCDISDEGQVKAFFSVLRRVDVLVNNAGVSVVKQIQDTTLQDWNALVGVNLTGAFLCSREAVKKMLSLGGGNIVNVSSVWGEVGASCEVAYSATKAGIIGLTKALAKEVGYSNIRVNCVTPGVIETSMNDHLSAEEKRELCSDIPAGRFGTGEEVAKAVLSLIDNEYCNGVVLPVNGGFSV